MSSLVQMKHFHSQKPTAYSANGKIQTSVTLHTSLYTVFSCKCDMTWHSKCQDLRELAELTSVKLLPEIL